MTIEGTGSQPIRPLTWSEHADSWRGYATSLLRNRPEIMDAYRKGGLLENQRWHRPANHQIVAAVMTIGISDLIKLDPKVDIVYTAATHDEDKKKQLTTMTRDEIIQHESQQNGPYKRATGTDFSQFDDWSLEERILRYVDSSLGEEDIVNYTDSKGKTHTLKSKRTVSKIVPWRQRVAGFKESKPDENQDGKWDRLYEITEQIEEELYQRTIEVNPGLAMMYPNHANFSQMVVDYIEYEIDQNEQIAAQQEKKDFTTWLKDNNKPLVQDTP